MKISLKNTEQVFDLNALGLEINNLCKNINNYYTIQKNCDLYNTFHDKAKQYYNQDISNAVEKIEIDLNYVNASLISLGLPTIEIER